MSPGKRSASSFSTVKVKEVEAALATTRRSPRSRKNFCFCWKRNLWFPLDCVSPLVLLKREMISLVVSLLISHLVLLKEKWFPLWQDCQAEKGERGRRQQLATNSKVKGGLIYSAGQQSYKQYLGHICVEHWMLSSVILNCQVTKIVMTSSSQLSEL